MKTKSLNNKINNFIDTLKFRHSYYDLTNGSPLTSDKLIKFIEECIYYHPSAFNVQSTRMVLLLNKNVFKIWNHVLDLIPNNFPKLLIKELKNCREAYASILFFDDMNATAKACEDYHMSIENFNSWAIQSMAMLQNVLWNGLTYLGYGANIQHFNKELDGYVQREFNLPDHWKLLSQMNIGLFSKLPSNRTRLPIKHLLTVRN